VGNNIHARNDSSIINRKRGLTEPGGKLRNLAAYLQHVRESERKCIAREIHDEIGQELAVLNMELSLLEKKIPIRHKSVHERIQSISGRIDKTIHIVQKIITELRPALIDKHSLQSAIEWQLEEFQKKAEIQCDVNIDIEAVTLDKEKEIYIYRIVQEILANIIRHAQATRVTFSLKESDGQLVISVIDNGIGIHEKQISNPKSFGIIGIMERISFLEGLFSITGIQNKGTTVRISVPIARNKTLTKTMSEISNMKSLNSDEHINRNC